MSTRTGAVRFILTEISVCFLSVHECSVPEMTKCCTNRTGQIVIKASRTLKKLKNISVLILMTIQKLKVDWNVSVLFLCVVF